MAIPEKCVVCGGVSAESPRFPRRCSQTIEEVDLSGFRQCPKCARDIFWVVTYEHTDSNYVCKGRYCDFQGTYDALDEYWD